MALGKEKHYGPQNRGNGIQPSYGPEQPRGIWKNFSCRTYPAVTNSGTAERRSRRRSRTTRICRGPLPTISAISRIFLPWSKCDITCRFLCHHCSSLNLEAATTGFRWRADRRTLGRSESAPTGIVLERPRGLVLFFWSPRRVVHAAALEATPFVAVHQKVAFAFSASLEQVQHLAFPFLSLERWSWDSVVVTTSKLSGGVPSHDVWHTGHVSLVTSPDPDHGGDADAEAKGGREVFFEGLV